MSQQRPLVAVSLGAATDPVPYVRALDAVGLDTRLLVPGEGNQDLPEDARGIVFCGGAAVHPSRFGQDLDPNIKKAVDEPRDAMEWGLMDAALARGLPILGICRGFQMINVYLGGTLTQNLNAEDWQDDHRPDAARDALAHPVVATGGELETVFGRDPFTVNSIHRQGIKVLAEGLLASVHTEDGLIEGYEDASRKIIAVQWHPEELIALPEQKRLLEHFAQRVGAGD
ncbi:gamma-glutamyl-gamma-aminobutyrate hydrolase family protein [Pelagibacterium mangrovi]|uniref:gamma-glutamyl-gamma-aminobutyrate hydrolase family protein n=1 Tax=Pelagibacterium mangrovi TaxID=3119828 RepID=UPI002FCA9719